MLLSRARASGPTPSAARCPRIVRRPSCWSVARWLWECRAAPWRKRA